MRQIILVVLVLLVVLLLIIRIYRRKVQNVSKGYTFCVMVEQLNDLCFSEDKIRTLTDQQKKYYFRDMDMNICYIEELYDSIKNTEKDFRVNDWYVLEGKYQLFTDIKSSVKFQKWMNGLT